VLTTYLNLKIIIMKNKLLVLASCLVLAMVSCKKSDSVTPIDQSVVTPIPPSAVAATVPSVVTSSFASRFAGATEVEWFSVTASNSQGREFEVEFNHSNQRHEARFDDKGVERHHGINCTDGPVPQVVLTAFRSTHPNAVVTEWKLRNDGTWRAHYLKGTVAWEATYTAAGVLVKDEIA
jgi:hypothetical protein